MDFGGDFRGAGLVWNCFGELSSRTEYFGPVRIVIGVWVAVLAW